MPKQAVRGLGWDGRRSLIPATSTFAVGVVMLVGTMIPAVALENISVLGSWDGSLHDIVLNPNPPGNSRNACQNQCRKYWYCNGKDAATYTLNCKFYSSGNMTNPDKPTDNPAGPDNVEPRRPANATDAEVAAAPACREGS